MPQIRSLIVRRSVEDFENFCQDVANWTEVPTYESKSDQNTRKTRAKTDYNFFVKEYFPKYADGGKTDCGYFHIDAAEAILADPNIMAAIEWPREHGKTVTMAMLIPLWLMINDQNDGTILIGREKNIAINELSNLMAVLEHNALFKHDWAPKGEFQTFGDWQSGDFTTKTGCRFLALGLGTTPRGQRKEEKRPNICVMFDLDSEEVAMNPRRVKKYVNYIERDVVPALSIKGSRFIIEGNRAYPDGIIATYIGDNKEGRPKREGLYHSRVYATQKPGVPYSKLLIDDGGVPSWSRYTLKELVEKFKKMGGNRSASVLAEFYHEHDIEGTHFNNFQWKPMLPYLKGKKYKIIIGYLDPSYEENPTSDFKALRVWALLPPEEFHCLKSFVRKTSIDAVFTFMAEYKDYLNSLGCDILYYIEKQWISTPFKDALKRVNNKRTLSGKKTLTVLPDDRKKENKFIRIMNMQPKHASGDEYYADEEFHNEDMKEGNKQLKGIEHGYRGADDSPDADEGAKYFLYQHIPGRAFKPQIKRHKRKNKY